MMDEHLRFLLESFNPWWSSGRVPRQYDMPFTRSPFGAIAGDLVRRQAVAITGLRRTGKTVLVHQLVRRLISDGVEPRLVMYFSFDEAMVAHDPRMLESLLEGWLGLLGFTRDDDRRAYVLLDEVQHVPYWQDIVKRYYDLYDGVKFVVTGSASLNVARRSRESLAGRVLDIEVQPMGFGEFCAFRGSAAELPDPLGAPDPRVLEAVAVARGRELGRLLDDYLLRGGFPEVAAEKDPDAVRRYIGESVVGRIVSRDIPEEYAVRDRNALAELARYCASQSGCLFQVSSLAGILGINRETVANYLTHLADSGLVAVCRAHGKSAAKQARTAKKLYVTDPGVMSAVTIPDRSPERTGRLVETAVYCHLRRGREVSFHRDARGAEVDFVVRTGDGLMPVEVKFQRSVHGHDLRHLASFMERNGCARGVVVTRDSIGAEEVGGGRVLLVPAWAFLAGSRAG